MEQRRLLDQLNTNLESPLPENNNFLQYVKVFSEVTANIRASVDLETIFQTTNKKVCELLQIDRVAVYRFNSDWGGEFVQNYEFISQNWKTLLTHNSTTIWDDTYLQETQGGRYRNNDTFAVDDIYQINHSPCHIQLLEQLYIKAYAIAPIFVDKKLWGLLAAYQLSESRQWQKFEVQFLHQIADQLGLALQQAKLLAQVSQQNFDLQKVIDQRQILSEITAKMRALVDLETIFQTTNKKVCELLQIDRVAVYCFNSDWGGEFVQNYEFISQNWKTLLTHNSTTIWDDTYLQETRGGRYRNNETFAVDDIYQTNHSPCHIQLLEQFYIKAYAIAPIFVGKKLWGLLAAYQLSESRQWQKSEVQFLHQIADQFGLALQQADLQKLAERYNSLSNFLLKKGQFLEIAREDIQRYVEKNQPLIK
ncbi:MAG: GAF domain-containing protein [Pelatocladus maniniholoensis HA4357-MV3]|jgi:GAF domain-containing protein|uniref:GAF domain-containing protein n=1 Tax=Pelatocladus maniniholoensis HA4357-MV3 TaxID=1117104 RepID=A0A9E3HBT8_9NOST|nr:GAF domain-containing protein [Pelatocladus maniniholoensis HA4357-MV3]